MAIPGISKIETLATKYSKPELAHMAQIGLIAPTDAVMAGMMIDRIMTENLKPPTTTVAQDVLAPGMPQMGMPGQPAPQQPQAPAPQEPQGPQMGMPPEAPTEAPTQMAASGGLSSLPAGDVGNYAGGGIVAFAGGGSPYEVERPTLERLALPEELSIEEAKKKNDELKSAFGINNDFYKERGAEVGAERQKLNKEKDNAWMDALIMGGLGAATGKSPYALSNIAEGGIKGFETYQGQMKDIRERDKALRESENKIKEAEYLRSIGEMDAADKKIVESQKLKRDAANTNVTIANDEAKAGATAANEARKTGYTEKMANNRVGMQIAAQKEIAAMPPAEQKLLQAVYEQEKAKNPDITMLEVYNKMHPGALSAQNSPQELVYKYTREWNDMLADPAAMSAFKKENPNVTNVKEYVKQQMELASEYTPKPKADITGSSKGAVGADETVDANNRLLRGR